MPIYAVIDVGTNTIRLLVAEAEGGATFRPLLQEQVITRLGERLQETGELSPAAMGRTIQVLKRFAEVAKGFGAEEVIAVATSAAREALNRVTFLQRVRREAGLQVAVASPETEAFLTAVGVCHALGKAYQEMLIIDIGGGSTEFARLEQGKIAKRLSLPIGAVKLTEAHLRSDPPHPAELRAAVTTIHHTLRGVFEAFGDCRGTSLVGTAGTITTLAAIDLGLNVYDQKRVTGHRLSRGRVQELLAQLTSLPLVGRRKITGLEPDRADVIVAGTLLTAEVMVLLGSDTLTVSDGGFREGILLHHLARGKGVSEADLLDKK